MSKITVVITTYNLEKQINKCLTELKEQSFQDFDIVIIDDYSKDNTISIAERFKDTFCERLKIKRVPHNLGSPAKTRNYALDSQLITGEYTVFLDGDDNIELNFLEILYNHAICTNADVVVCAYDRVEEKTKRVLCKEMVNYPSTITLPPQDDALCFMNGSLWNKLFKTSIIRDLRVPDFKVGEDLCFQLLVYNRCNKIKSIKDILIHYNVRENSIIASTQKETIYQFAEELSKQYKEANTQLKDIIALIAFIHIGLSMTIRAYDNKEINIKDHLKWTKQYFKKEFNDFKENKYMSLRALAKHGIKGYGIWGCKVLYKLSLFRIFLHVYRVVTKTFHIDLKF